MENLAIVYFAALILITVTSAWVIRKNFRENRHKGSMHKPLHH